MKLKDMPIGSIVYDESTAFFSNAIRWVVLDHDHAGYPQGAATLLSESLLALQAFDAAESDSPDDDHGSAGNQNYELSNIRQWLNSDQIDWYTPQHIFDMPPILDNFLVSDNPYKDRPGFLSNFSQGFMDAMLPTDISYIRPSDVGGGTILLQDKIFLLSATEMSISTTNVEGTAFTYFTDNASRLARPTASCIANDASGSVVSVDTPWRYWTRSYYNQTVFASLVRIVSPTGSSSYYDAADGRLGIRPTCNLMEEIEVEMMSANVGKLIFPEISTRPKIKIDGNWVDAMSHAYLNNQWTPTTIR